MHEAHGTDRHTVGKITPAIGMLGAAAAVKYPRAALHAHQVFTLSEGTIDLSSQAAEQQLAHRGMGALLVQLSSGSVGNAAQHKRDPPIPQHLLTDANQLGAPEVEQHVGPASL